MGRVGDGEMIQPIHNRKSISYDSGKTGINVLLFCDSSAKVVNKDDLEG